MHITPTGVKRLLSAVKKSRPEWRIGAKEVREVKASVEAAAAARDEARQAGAAANAPRTTASARSATIVASA